MNSPLYPTIRKRYPTESSTRGFGIVELMVAVAIGMVVVLVMMQVFARTEQWNRNTSQGSDTQTNVQLAAYIISQNLGNAGGSLTSTRCANAAVEPPAPQAPGVPPVPGRYRTQYDRVWIGGNSGSNFFLPMLPVIITSLDTARGDQLEFLLQRGSAGIGGQRLWDQVRTPADPLVVRAFQGLENGGWMLVSTADPKEDTKGVYFDIGGTPFNCVMVRLTDIQLITGGPSTGLYNLSHTPAFPQELLNTPDGLGKDANNVGENPSAHWVQGLGRIESTTLAVAASSADGPSALIRTVADVDDPNGTDSTTFIEAPDVVHLRAFYGFDNKDDPDGTVTDWLEADACRMLDTDDINTMGWQCRTTNGLVQNNERARTSERLVAVRFGVIMRVAQHDKDYAADTTPPPDRITLWRWTDVVPPGVRSPSDPVYTIPNDDKNAEGVTEYRYRIFQAVVPIRSSIWNVSKP